MRQNKLPAMPDMRVSIGVIMLFQVSALVVRSFVRIKLLDSGMAAAEAKHLSALVGFAMLALLMWPILRNNWHALNHLFAKPDSWLRLIIASIALGILLWLANTLVLIGIGANAWQKFADLTAVAVPAYDFTCRNPIILVFVIPVMSVLTPFAEETISRGMILHKLMPSGRWLAIALSAFLFAALHTPQMYAPAFVFGLVTAVQVLHWRTLWGAIITHGTVNLLVEIDQICIHERWDPDRIDWVFGRAPQIAVLVFVLCVAASCWLATRENIGVGAIKSRPNAN